MRLYKLACVAVTGIRDMRRQSNINALSLNAGGNIMLGIDVPRLCNVQLTVLTMIRAYSVHEDE